jgi:hypothetical protein
MFNFGVLCLFFLPVNSQVSVRANAHGNKMAIRKGKDGKIVFSGEKPPTPILDTINYPVHMKNLSTQVPSIFPFQIALILARFLVQFFFDTF